VAPQIKQLQQRAERIRQQELDKSLRKLAVITDAQLAAIDALTRSIVKKLLHEPIKALKGSAGTYEPRSHTLASSRELLLSRNPEYASIGADEVSPMAAETVSITT